MREPLNDRTRLMHIYFPEIIDIESYQNMIDAFNMLKLLRFSENDIKNGRFSEASEVFARVKQKYGING